MISRQLGSILYLAQLGLQLLGALLLVKLPFGRVIGASIVLWAVSLYGMAGSANKVSQGHYVL